MKSEPRLYPLHRSQSSPSRGTWIEIPAAWGSPPPPWSSPSRGTWIEIRATGDMYALMGSSPSRGTWIEMSRSGTKPGLPAVVPLTGDVD